MLTLLPSAGHRILISYRSNKVHQKSQVADTGLVQQQEDWQPVPKETPVFRNVPVANPADLVALKEERPPLPPIKRPVTPPPTMQIQGGPTGFHTTVVFESLFTQCKHYNISITTSMVMKLHWYNSVKPHSMTWKRCRGPSPNREEAGTVQTPSTSWKTRKSPTSSALLSL